MLQGIMGCHNMFYGVMGCQTMFYGVIGSHYEFYGIMGSLWVLTAATSQNFRKLCLCLEEE